MHNLTNCRQVEERVLFRGGTFHSSNDGCLKSCTLSNKNKDEGFFSKILALLKVIAKIVYIFGQTLNIAELPFLQ